MGAHREAAHLVGSLGRRLLLALVLAVLLRRVEVKPGQGEVREGKMKENFEDTILISSNAHTPVQERGGARGDKWLHDTFIR